MPRNSSGTYTLPAGNPVVSNTIIEAIWANVTMPDIAAALTDSLSRTGLGGMSVPLLFSDGAIGAPGIAWTLEPSSGFYRAGNNDFRVSLAGNDKVRWKTGSAMEFFIASVWTSIESLAGLASVSVVASAANKNFAAVDAQTMQLLTGGTNRTWTMPLHATVPFNKGDTIILAVQSTAVLTIAMTAGATMNSAIAQASGASRQVISGGTACLTNVDGADNWQLSGDIL